MKIIIVNKNIIMATLAEIDSNDGWYDPNHDNYFTTTMNPIVMLCSNFVTTNYK